MAVDGESKLTLLLLLPRFLSLSATSEMKDLDRPLFLVEQSRHTLTLFTERALLDSNGKTLLHL